MINITAAPLRQATGMRGFKQATNGRHRAEKLTASANGTKEPPLNAHSTGTISSFARAMLSCERAADSIAFGSLLKRRISVSSAAFPRRNESTSCCIRENCDDALRISP